MMLAVAATSGSLSDPEGGTLVAAASWINAALLGSVATAIAIIAIALVGFGMMAGRIDWRRGVMAVAGCFLLFGAPAIVAGLSMRGDANAQVDPTRATMAAAPIAQPPDPTYDPYAGASLIR